MDNEEMNLAELLKQTGRGKPNKKDFSNLRRKREFRRCKRKSKSPT